MTAAKHHLHHTAIQLLNNAAQQTLSRSPLYVDDAALSGDHNQGFFIALERDFPTPAKTPDAAGAFAYRYATPSQEAAGQQQVLKDALEKSGLNTELKTRPTPNDLPIESGVYIHNSAEEVIAALRKRTLHREPPAAGRRI